MARRLAAALVALVGVAVASAAPCPDGRFFTTITSKRSGPLAAELVIADGQASLGSLCGPAAAHLRPSRRGTTVRATWPRCTKGRRVVLRLILDDACWSGTGIVHGRGLRPSFSAIRTPSCGNGVPEPGEACDDGNAVDGDCCSATCATEVACAVSCVSDAVCGPGAYCARPGGQCDAMGTCATRPAVCQSFGDPACGCDGRTYATVCAAAAAGVSAAVCNPVCGTIAGITCPAGDFCDFEPGKCRGADLAGVCVAVGNICAQNFDPVCGCDGKTYSNDCERRVARVQKAHDGACATAMPY